MLWETLAAPWQACIEEAWLAYCAGALPIGAVVADANGKILTRGRRRFPPDGHALAHAELLALIALESAGTASDSCVLYGTTEPCPLCVGALLMSRVRSLRYAARDPWAGSAALLQATPYTRRKGIHVQPHENPLLETILAAMQVEWMLHDGRSQAENPVLNAWAIHLPESFRLGEQLWEARLLRQMRERDAPVSEVINTLARLLA